MSSNEGAYNLIKHDVNLKSTNFHILEQDADLVKMFLTRTSSNLKELMQMSDK
jgi:hypothetical protein